MLHCINCPDSELTNGALYYEKKEIAYAYDEVVNEDNAKMLWEISEELLKE